MDIKETRWDRIPLEEKIDVVKELFSADVPWGLYNVVPESIRKGLALIDPRWMSWREETLARKADVTERDENLRLSFWTEYNVAKDMDKPFSINRAIAGACSPYYFKTKILKTPMLLAYIVYPPTDYMTFMKGMLYKGQKRMQEIMSASAVEHERDKDGKIIGSTVNMKLANLQLKTFALIDNRVKGAIVQRVKVEQKNLNVNVTPDQIANATPTTLIDIDKELTMLDREIQREDERLKVRSDLDKHRRGAAQKAIPLDIVVNKKEDNH